MNCTNKLNQTTCLLIMSASLYVEGKVLQKQDTTTLLNSLTLTENKLKKLNITEQNVIDGCLWFLTDAGVFRFVEDNHTLDKYHERIYFSSVFFKYAIETKLIQDLTLLMIEHVSNKSKFYLVTKDEFSVEYSIVLNNCPGIYINHDVISKEIYSYLVDQTETLLIHDQIFLVLYKTFNNVVTIPVKITIKSLNSNHTHAYISAINKTGLMFNSMSKGIKINPSLQSLDKNVYTTSELIKSMQVTFSLDSESKACSFVNSNPLKNIILNRLKYYSIKLGTTGSIKIKGKTISFKIVKINDQLILEKNQKKDQEKIYKFDESSTDYMYKSKEDSQTMLVEIPKSRVISDVTQIKVVENLNYSYDESNKIDETDSNTGIDLDLLYEPTLNGNVVFIDSNLEAVPAKSITIEIKLNNSSQKYFYWDSQHTAQIEQMLKSKKTINESTSSVIINGQQCEISIIDCNPRTMYELGTNHKPHADVFYSETTQLIINTNSDSKRVIITDDVKDDTVISFECIVKKKEKEITASNIHEFLELMYSKPKISETLMLDERRLLDDVIESGTVFEGKSIDFVVPQFNVNISLKITNIKWAKLKTRSNNKSNKTHIGFLDIENVLVKWICSDDIFIVQSIIYSEKSYNDIVNWCFENKIGGLDKTLWDIYKHLIILRNPDTVKTLKTNGLKPSKGIILYGPPGNGKTKIARSIGKLLGSKDEHIKLCSATELLSKWVGESEKNIARLFEPAERANALFGENAPLYTVIIDEIDIIAQQRDYDSCNKVGVGCVNQLLTKLDGLIEKDNIIVIGLTNREKVLDKALLREGRLDRMIHIGMPDFDGRKMILDLYVRPWIHLDLDKLDDVIDYLASNTEGFSGADIQGFVSYVVKEHWTTFLGSTNLESETLKNKKQYVPIDMFKSLISVYKLEK